jgi:hypothetical protein
MTDPQPPGHWRNSSRYKRLRTRFFADVGASGVCGICTEPVDMRLSGRHQLGPSVDHVRPYARGGIDPLDVTNWQLAHRACNSAKGIGMTGPSGGGGQTQYVGAHLPDHYSNDPTSIGAAPCLAATGRLCSACERYHGRVEVR